MKNLPALHSVPVSMDNLDIIRNIWKTNFPKEAKEETPFFDDKDIFECSINNLGDLNAKYFIVYENDTPVGQWGLYTTTLEQNETAWLGWFSVLPKFRRLGYGSHILTFFETMAKAEGFKFIRLYTSKDNIPAQECYKKFGFVLEDFIGTTDMETEPLVIGSKSISDTPVQPWGNKPMEL